MHGVRIDTTGDIEVNDSNFAANQGAGLDLEAGGNIALIGVTSIGNEDGFLIRW